MIDPTIDPMMTQASTSVSIEAPIDEGWFDRYYGLSTTGKIFLAAVAAALIGKISNVRVRGTQDQIDALKSALMTSREFNDEINRPGATVQSVMEKLRLKNISAEEFEARFGVPFPL